MARENILSVKNLSKTYEDTQAVKGVSFEVKEGEVFGILGPNGAGKTTTLEMIETLKSIDSGEAIVDGVSVVDDPDYVKSNIGVQLQSSNFFDRLNLRELLRLFASFYYLHVDPDKILKQVNLLSKAESYVDDLSGGQKQRFSIAAALVNKPKLLFLDEPTTGLDPQARRSLWSLVEDIKADGVTVVLTTHYMDEAEFLCDRIAIMDMGEIIALDTPDNLIQQLIDRGFTKEAQIRQASLEDVFLDLTGKELRD